MRYHNTTRALLASTRVARVYSRSMHMHTSRVAVDSNTVGLKYARIIYEHTSYTLVVCIRATLATLVS